MTPKSLIATAACCWLLPAAAVVTRSDRDDSEYLELASRYTSSVPLNAPGGEAVLIAPRWLLTAASVAKSLKGRSLTLGEGTYDVVAVYPQGEIALVQLKSFVRGVPVTPLYRWGDEAGKTVVIVGHGNADGKKRAAINTIDRVEALGLRIQLKEGDDRSDLQGALAPGDLGGPAIAEIGGGLYVIGIATAVAVGGWETYARVSAWAPWIDETLLAAARAENDALLEQPGN